MRVLLHACCGPCLLEPFDALAREHEVTVAYANPNIHPAEEYERRRDTLFAHAAAHGIEVVELPYEPERWRRAVTGLEGDPQRRCRACLGLRLGMVAERAAGGGFEAVATSLTVSPYQDPDAISEAGRDACDAMGVTYLVADFRDRYAEATRRSREKGMYRQNYCGCEFSRVEAEQDREARRAARNASRAGG